MKWTIAPNELMYYSAEYDVLTDTKSSFSARGPEAAHFLCCFQAAAAISALSMSYLHLD